MSKTIIVCWPACQSLMDCEGFRENSALCTSYELYRDYGDSAYAVDENWLETLPAETLNKVFSLQETYPGPEVDFGSLEKTDGFMTI